MHVEKSPHADASPKLTLPNNGDIAQRAYQRWVARGCPVSDGLEDWFAAEAELNASSPSPPSSPAAQPAPRRTIRSALRRLGL